MIEQHRVVGYVFSYVAQAIKTKEGLGDNVWIRRQLQLIRKYASENGYLIDKMIVGTSTYRGKSFADFSVFDEAVARGVAHNYPIVIADLRELLRRTNGNLMVKAITKLDRVPTTIIDATSGQNWVAIPGTDKQSMILEATRAHHARSQAIKTGQGLKWEERRAPPKSNRLLGANANRISAENRAAALSPFLATLENTLPPGVTLSPSLLARKLNEAAIPAGRSSTWSVNAAKNLLDRLKR